MLNRTHKHMSMCSYVYALVRSNKHSHIHIHTHSTKLTQCPCSEPSPPTLRWSPCQFTCQGWTSRALSAIHTPAPPSHCITWRSRRLHPHFPFSLPSNAPCHPWTSVNKPNLHWKSCAWRRLLPAASPFIYSDMLKCTSFRGKRYVFTNSNIKGKKCHQHNTEICIMEKMSLNINLHMLMQIFLNFRGLVHQNIKKNCQTRCVLTTLMIMCVFYSTKGDYSSQTTPSVWVSEPEFITLTAAFIALRKNLPDSPLRYINMLLLTATCCATLQCWEACDHKEKMRHGWERWKGRYPPWERKKERKQEAVATFSHDPCLDKKVKNTSDLYSASI